MEQPKRLFDFPLYQLEKFPREVMMTSKVNGEWQTWSTQQFVDQMNAMSRGLLKLGVQPGEKIALISHNNRTEWNISDHAILQIGAIDVPIYPTMSASDYEYIFNHAGITHCFVSNQELFEKVESIRGQVPSMKNVYTYEEVPGAKNWKEVLDAGAGDDNSEVERIREGVDPLELATIIYTSGTTGLPKGVMLSHNCIASNAIDSCERLPEVSDRGFRTCSFLPVCHIFERMLHYLYIYNGATIYFAESLETVKEDLFHSKPMMFTAVPRLLEKFYDGIVAKGAAAGGVKSKLFAWAVGLALQWEPEGKNGAFYEFKLKIARKLVFSKVKEALGLTEIEAVASGSAALQPRLARFFNGAGIPVYEGYGLTETSPVISVNTLNSDGMLRVGSVGKPIKNVEVKIAEDGEILCKGPNVMMGYYNDEEKTNEVLKDGWFHTGDIGVVDDGFLRITDRKKEIFKTSGGKYVAPQLLENSLKESLYIEQCMVIGEARKHPSALIVPAFDALKEWCRRHDIEWTVDDVDACDPRVKARIQEDIDRLMEPYGTWERVKKVQYLKEPFSIEGGELTPTLKLKRKPILSKYADVIEKIYVDP
ncbi:AMP-dependent synthetase/ligase [Sanyastnella coralliicola]|uniref:AMP-dependent synthetase/ligase n=1 Tax=Sanyastnella coralliicola TaxID=3069118 RepID=UPI0027B9695D|nr:long-chain fatty acid--CoA ligase [Longitalea sp. SCSIO 12813]